VLAFCFSGTGGEVHLDEMFECGLNLEDKVSLLVYPKQPKTTFFGCLSPV
jgi:hypothetical protein